MVLARTSGPSRRQQYSVAALEKGLRLLALFAEHRGDMRLSEMSAALNIPVPTAFRLLRTLERMEYVEQTKEGRFRPSLSVLRLGFAALQRSSLLEAARPPMQRLADATSETVNLGILVETRVLYLHRIRRTELTTMDVQVGSYLPAECNSMGKILLAALADAELEQRLARIEFDQCIGPNALTSANQLRNELLMVRGKGWASQDQENAEGVRSIAVPIRDHSGQVVAALNLPVQVARWPMKRLIGSLLVPALQAALDISRALGFSADS